MTDYIHKDKAVAYVLENCFDEISEAILTRQDIKENSAKIGDGKENE